MNHQLEGKSAASKPPTKDYVRTESGKKRKIARNPYDHDGNFRGFKS
jgi:hypothetical protein